MRGEHEWWFEFWREEQDGVRWVHLAQNRISRMVSVKMAEKADTCGRS